MEVGPHKYSYVKEANMKVGDGILYHGYPITHPCKEDYTTEIAHDTLNEAKEFIDMLQKRGLIENGDKELT